jgi:peptidoglycan/LPS O-acetylase OafA/YrhL
MLIGRVPSLGSWEVSARSAGRQRMTSGKFDPAFYSTTAQVVPVLFVLLAIELRMFSRRENAPKETPTRALFLLTIAILLAASELFSLAALHDRKQPARIVDAVIFIGFGLSGAAAVGPFIMARAEGLGRNPITRWGTLIVLYGGLALFTLSAFGVVLDPQVAIGVLACIPLAGWVVASLAEDVQEFRGSRRERPSEREDTPPAGENAHTGDGVDPPVA